jgi:RNA polymerase I-specific transcription initiation factor RRN3
MNDAKELGCLETVYLTLLSIFERSIIRTHKAKYVPVLIFYASSLDESFSETFIAHLVARIFDASCSEYLGITAAGYLGSFLARAKHVSPKTISDTLKLCAEWAHSYLDRLEAHPNGRAFVWYSLVQAILYVFCFRWRELTVVETGNKRKRLDSTSSNKGISFASADFETATSQEQRIINGQYMSWWRVRGGFQRIVYSHLNPLRICASAVASEFDKISKSLELVYCSSIIGTNKNAPSPVARTALLIDVPLEEMIESFFPFDPYFEELSIRPQIEPIYQTWQSISPEEDEDDID